MTKEMIELQDMMGSSIKRVPADRFLPRGESGIYKLLGINTKVVNMNPYGDLSADDCEIRAACVAYQAAQNKEIKPDAELYHFLYNRLSALGDRKCKLMNHISVMKDFMKDLGFESITYTKNVSIGTFMHCYQFGVFVIGVNHHCFPYVRGTIYDASDRALDNISEVLGFPIEILFTHGVTNILIE